jgi:DNA-binding transcriptional LysR family regulator
VRRDHPTIDYDMTLDQFLAAEHAVVTHEGRSQEIFERRMSELNLDRRILLRLPHFMSVPLLVATSDMITVVPRAVGLLYVRLASLKLVEPPIEIPPIEIKQFWHRRVHNDPSGRTSHNGLCRRKPLTSWRRISGRSSPNFER